MLAREKMGSAERVVANATECTQTGFWSGDEKQVVAVSRHGYDEMVGARSYLPLSRWPVSRTPGKDGAKR